MTAITREAVLDLLRTVPEPCSLLMGGATDIVDMGLVEQVDIAGGRVAVTLVLTDTSCVHFTGIRRYIDDVLGAHEAVDEVDVRLSTTVVWTPDRARRGPLTELL
jgi:metal-sulfur cluster biosynthetic enzyme